MKWFYRLSWLICGLVAGVIASPFLMERFSPKPAVSSPRFEYSDQESWLFGQETTLEALFPDSGMAAAIRNPEKIELHRIGGDGRLVLGKYHFDSQARIPDQDHLKLLRGGLVSLNAYTYTGKLCTFSPAVLVRLYRNGGSFDLLFCFGCHDIGTADGPLVGMSEEGASAFLRYFSEVFPEFVELEQLRPR